MLRFLAAVVLRLLANAVGVALAAWLLDGFSVTTAAFVGVVILFTLIEVVLDPLVLKISLQYAPVLRGGVALVTTLVGLIVTTIDLRRARPSTGSPPGSSAPSSSGSAACWPPSCCRSSSSRASGKSASRA